MLQDKQIETQNKILEKQLQYFKTKTQGTSNDMVKALNNLTRVVTMAFTQDATNNKEYTQDVTKNHMEELKVINHHTTWKDCVQVDTLTPYEKSYLLKPKYLTTKASNQLIYNYIKL